MNIGIDCRLWNETGVGRYIRNLVTELAKIDSENSYTLFFCKKEFETVAVPAKNFKKELLDIRWHTVSEQLKLPRILEKYHFDLFHFPYFSVPVGYKKPYVVTIHDLIIDHFPTGQASTLPLPLYRFKHFSYQQIVRIAAKNAKMVIAPSMATKKEIIDHYKIPEKKIFVTYEGVDTALTKKGTKSFIESPYFLYVGNAYPHKNVDRLVQAFSLLKNEHSESAVKLVLVGKSDPFYIRLKEKVKKQKIKDIVFTGFVEDTELVSLYDNATAVVVPSLMEGFALPALEALSRGSIVLASNIPVIKEVCDDAVMYFDPKDPESIKARMIDILTFPKNLEVLKEKGKNLVQKYSWEKMAKETLEIYKKATNG